MCCLDTVGSLVAVLQRFIQAGEARQQRVLCLPVGVFDVFSYCCSWHVCHFPTRTNIPRSQVLLAALPVFCVLF